MLVSSLLEREIKYYSIIRVLAALGLYFTAKRCKDFWYKEQRVPKQAESWKEPVGAT